MPELLSNGRLDGRSNAFPPDANETAVIVIFDDVIVGK